MPDVFPSSREYVPQESRAVEPVPPASASPRSSPVGPSSSTDPPSPTETTFVPAKVECCPPVVAAEIESRDVAKEVETTLASSRDNEGREIDSMMVGSSVSSSESPVATTVAEDEACKRQESETDRVEENAPLHVTNTSKRADEAPPLDGAQNEVKPPCHPVSKEALVDVSVKETGTRDDTSASATESESRSPEVKPLDQSPMGDYGDAKDEAAVVAERVMKVPDVTATDKVMNETSPVVECQIKSEINNYEDPMKTNVSPNAGHDEKVETATLLPPPTEIETNSSACPAIKQQLAFENLETEETESTCPMGKGSDNKAEIVEEPCERPTTVEPEHNYAKDAPIAGKEATTIASSEQTEPVAVSAANELVIDSEEGPLSVSDDIVVEAKLAVVIPEDDSVEELTDTTESLKMIPETDEEKIENEPESDTALPTEETLISEEDMSAPEDGGAIVELLNDTKTVYVEDDLPPPPPSEDAALFDSQIPEPPCPVSAIDAESIAVKVDPVVVFSTSVEPVDVEPVSAEPVTAEPVAAELVATSFAQIEQTEEIESCPLRATPPGESCLTSESEPTHCSSSEFPDPPTDLLRSLEVGENQSSEPQTSPPSSLSENNVPIATDLPLPMPEDTGMSSFDYSQSHAPNASEPSAPPGEHAAYPRDPTETLLTPPMSPSSQSNANVTSDHATSATKDYPQTLSNDEDDRSNRESQTATTGSVSAPPTSSCNHSDVESNERLAFLCLAETECQEGALSCQLSDAVLSTAAQEHHQVTNMQHNLLA